MSELVAQITRRALNDIVDALYNLNSAQELIDQGVSVKMRVPEAGVQP